MGTRAMPIYLFLILLVKSVCGYLNIDVSNVGYSYSVTTVVGSTPYDLVVSVQKMNAS